KSPHIRHGRSRRPCRTHASGRRLDRGTCPCGARQLVTYLTSPPLFPVVPSKPTRCRPAAPCEGTHARLRGSQSDPHPRRPGIRRVIVPFFRRRLVLLGDERPRRATAPPRRIPRRKPRSRGGPV